MTRTMIVVFLGVLIAFPAVVFAQEIIQPFPDGGPYDPEKDCDIDMYLCSWKTSFSRQMHGNLVVKDILVKGNSLNPSRRGAVLNYINHVSHATLEARAKTPNDILKGTQEIWYVVAGRGTVTTSKRTVELYKGIVVFMPEGLDFTIANTGSERLEMYLVSEPTPKGFKPITTMLVKDENMLPYISIGGHWWHKVKQLFTDADGFAQIENVLIVSFDPMTLGHPHIYPAGQLEVWLAVEGTTTGWIGKQIRLQPPGSGYMVPPNGTISHSNINNTCEEAKFFYIFSTPK